VLPVLVARCVLSAEAMTKGKLREETGMRKKLFVLMTLLWGCAGGAHLGTKSGSGQTTGTRPAEFIRCFNRKQD
jgi:hypothetical protein